MPASEFVEWQAYFTIFPFSEDREEIRNAELISWLTYISSLTAQGKGLKNKIPAKDLVHDYLAPYREPKKFVPKSREQQKQEFAAFVAKHKALEKAVQGK